MEAQRTKLVDNGSGIFAKRQCEGVGGANGFGEKRKSQCCGLRSSVCKRKRADTCSTWYNPSERLKYYSNFIESSLLSRILFFENGEWNDFPPQVVASARKHFQLKNAAIEVKFNECHYLLDILYMIQWDLETGIQKQIAWVDDNGRQFFPEILLGVSGSGTLEVCQIDEERDSSFEFQLPEGNQDVNVQVRIDIKGAPVHHLERCDEESDVHARKLKIRRGTLGGHGDLGIDPNLDQDNHASEEVDGGCQPKVEEIAIGVTPNYKLLEPATVRDIFLTGMQLFGGARLLEIMPCSGHFMQSRMEPFAKQVEITSKNRGDPNVRYAWLASNKDASSILMMYAIDAGGFTSTAINGSEIHLTPVDDPHASAKNCVADVEGMQYLILCRVILGNVELVNPTSNQCHPTSPSFDSGVDNPQNPHLYIVWSKNASTHIFPEYRITFRMAQETQGTLVMKETSMAILGKTSSVTPNGGAVPHHFPAKIGGISPPLADDGMEKSRSRDVDHPAKITRSTWMRFPLLLESVSREISPKDMEMVNVQYQLLKSKKITKDDFIKQLRLIVGDGLLRSCLLSLHPKLSRKSPK